MARRDIVYGLVVLAVVAAAGAGYIGNQLEARHRLEQRARALTGGDPAAGRDAIVRRPCGSCHEIPGVPGAKGKAGPPLTGFAGRVYIAGRLDNSPDNLVGWLLNPQAVDPQTAMPPTGLSDRDARDVAAYLYTLK